MCDRLSRAGARARVRGGCARAIDLAGLLADQGRREGSRALLRPVFEQFAEGLGTADLKAAERLLATLG